jgi:hypothetical protein
MNEKKKNPGPEVYWPVPCKPEEAEILIRILNNYDDTIPKVARVVDPKVVEELKRKVKKPKKDVVEVD